MATRDLAALLPLAESIADGSPIDWDAAEALSRECEKMNSSHLDQLYALYRERIAYFRINPPPSQWDGTAEAMSK